MDKTLTPEFMQQMKQWQEEMHEDLLQVLIKYVEKKLPNFDQFSRQQKAVAYGLGARSFLLAGVGSMFQSVLPRKSMQDIDHVTSAILRTLANQLPEEDRPPTSIIGCA